MIQLGLVTMVVAGLTLGSCKKSDDDDDTEDGTEQSEMSGDESTHNNELESSLNEADAVAGASGFGKGATVSGATIDDSTFIGSKKIVITYNGLSGDGLRMRTGEVTMQLITGTKWSDAGAVMKIDAKDLRITKQSSGKSIVINGTHYITNVSGGRAWLNPSVTHKVRGNTEVAFDNGTKRSWQVARVRTFTNNSGVLTATIAGDTTINGYSNVVVWGTNRRGISFYTQITQPIVFNSICTNRPISGIKIHNGLSKAITVTFGVDVAGNPTTGGSGCPYGLKINWQDRKNNTRTAVISY